MKLSVIGASGTFPTPGHPASGYLITQGHTRVWCDAGPGTFVNLPVDPDLIDAVFLSHEHPDHCLDLLTAYHAFRYRPEPRLGIPVYAPQSTSIDWATSLPATSSFGPSIVDRWSGASRSRSANSA